MWQRGMNNNILGLGLTKRLYCLYYLLIEHIICSRQLQLRQVWIPWQSVQIQTTSLTTKMIIKKPTDHTLWHRITWRIPIRNTSSPWGIIWQEMHCLQKVITEIFFLSEKTMCGNSQGLLSMNFMKGRKKDNCFQVKNIHRSLERYSI